MITLTTPITTQPSTHPISHSDRILSFGSCFAEHISAQLDRHHFNLCANPSGILYNPAAIQQTIARLLTEKKFTTDDLFHHNELWGSLMHHGRFSHPDPATALNQMNHEFNQAVEQLHHTDVLLLTLGTAFAWYVKEPPKRAVANCHKLPARTFERRMLPAHEIAQQLGTVIRKLQQRNPELRVILTVSPVRHLRHSAPENSLSKAQLITACHLLSAELDYTHYFPAYEIMLDELRDYRFYADDLVHPNELARRIIWERFSESWIDEKSRQFMADHTPVLNMKNHRPLHPDTKSAAKFQVSLKNKIAALQHKYPDIPVI